MVQRTILATVTGTLIVLLSASPVGADSPTPTPSPSSTPQIVNNVDQSGDGVNISNNNSNINTNSNTNNININTVGQARVAGAAVPRTLPATGADVASTLALFGTIPLGLKLARFKLKADANQ